MEEVLDDHFPAAVADDISSCWSSASSAPSFDTFGIIGAVTSGGLPKATEVLVTKVYYDGVHSLNLGSSSAQSVILMAS